MTAPTQTETLGERALRILDEFANDEDRYAFSNFDDAAMVVRQFAADLREAAGECLIPIPEPGTDLARLCIANTLLRHANSSLHSELSALQSENTRLRASLASLANIAHHDADFISDVLDAKCRLRRIASDARRLLPPPQP